MSPIDQRAVETASRLFNASLNAALFGVLYRPLDPDHFASFTAPRFTPATRSRVAEVFAAMDRARGFPRIEESRP